jgi:hypothetical protein
MGPNNPTEKVNQAAVGVSKEKGNEAVGEEIRGLEE